jgi:hypothetical protein
MPMTAEHQLPNRDSDFVEQPSPYSRGGPCAKMTNFARGGGPLSVEAHENST